MLLTLEPDDDVIGRGTTMLQSFDDYRRNLKLALRLVWKSPQFAWVSIVSMAVGIGATATFFTLADAVLFRQLPFPDGARLVQVSSAMPRRNVTRSRLIHAGLLSLAGR